MSNKQTVIEVKLQRSASSLAEANLMMQNGFYNAVVNRLYYACFYATQALLLTKNVVPKTHSGVAAQLHQQFVQPGNFDKRLSAFYTRLMQERKDSDYSDFLIITKVEAESLNLQTKEYLDYIISLIPPPGTPDTANNQVP